MSDGATDPLRGTRELPEDDRVEAPAAHEPAPGAMIGRFVVRGRLGGGGMGVVYAADDPDLGRRVALKLVRTGDERPTLRARFLREAQAMAQLDHPHVVRVHEVGEADGGLFIAMELVDGDTLTTWLATPRPWREILAVFRQAGRGLAAIHGAGLVHRDVKPDNVLVDRGGRARVADLGLVRALAATSNPALDAALTHTGMVLGTPGFMAPEQQRGDTADARADQYAFCVALREALRDAAPPPAVGAALARGLSFDPDDRFPSMDALLAVLDRAAVPPPRRWGIAVAAAAVTVTGLAVTVIVVSSASSTSSDRAAPAAPIAALDAVADAAVDRVPVPGAGVEAPPDAGVAPLARDAAVARVEARDRPPAASSPAAASRPAGGSAASAAPAARRPTTPPPAPGTPLSAAHLAALRVAIRDAGYRGVTLAELDKDLDGTARSFQEDLDKRLADGEDHTLWLLVDRTMLGAVARRRGDCKTAEARFAEALRSGPSTLPDSPDRDKGFLWYGRAHLGKALCRLAAGDLAGADKAFKNAAMIGWGGGGRLELADADLGWGILHYERGDLDGARSILRRTGRGGDAPLRAALEAWLTAVDWDLREPYHPLLGLDGKPVGSERTAGTP